MPSIIAVERRQGFRRLGPGMISGIVAVGLLLVGLVDFYTGIDVRIFPLYFLPLALAGQRLGVSGAVAASLAASVIWVAAMYWGGRHYPHDWIWVVNFFTQGIAFLAVTLLVAILERRHRREYELSRTDGLTGLLNSRAFLEQGTAMLAEGRRLGQPVTLAYIDLDHFKQVNDKRGHEAGDLLLETVGRTMREAIGAQGVVARVGGDEFAVLLPNTDRDHALVVLERLRQDLLDDERIRDAGVSASVGGVCHRTEGPSLDVLIKRADDAMYRVKNAGRNAVLVLDASD